MEYRYRKTSLYCRIAQSVERRSVKPWVAGSSPAAAAKARIGPAKIDQASNGIYWKDVDPQHYW